MTETIQLRVLDFDCPTCANTVERTLRKLEGVEDADVHYATGRIEVRYDPAVVEPSAFERAIANHGYAPQPA